jgi:hypothetical protein
MHCGRSPPPKRLNLAPLPLARGHRAASDILFEPSMLPHRCMRSLPPQRLSSLGGPRGHASPSQPTGETFEVVPDTISVPLDPLSSRKLVASQPSVNKIESCHSVGEPIFHDIPVYGCHHVRARRTLSHQLQVKRSQPQQQNPPFRRLTSSSRNFKWRRQRPVTDRGACPQAGRHPRALRLRVEPFRRRIVMKLKSARRGAPTKVVRFKWNAARLQHRVVLAK